MTRRSTIAGLSATGAVLCAPSLARGARPRIVTVGSGVTETVFALGRGQDVCATDAASIYPAAAATLAKLDYPKGISARALLDHRPDIVFVADEAGPKDALDEIAESGVRYLRLPEPRSMTDISAGVRLIAEALAESARGDALADALSADLSLVADAMRGVATRRRALVLLGSPDADMLIVAGRGSPAAIALEFAGADNAADAITGWSWIAPSAARELDPEAVVALLGATPVSSARMLAAPGVQNTTAGREKRVATVDAQAFTGFGPRAAHAIHSVASRIYPEARVAPLPARQWAGGRDRHALKPAPQEAQAAAIFFRHQTAQQPSRRGSLAAA